MDLDMIKAKDFLIPILTSLVFLYWFVQHLELFTTQKKGEECSRKLPNYASAKPFHFIFSTSKRHTSSSSNLFQFFFMFFRFHSFIGRNNIRTNSIHRKFFAVNQHQIRFNSNSIKNNLKSLEMSSTSLK